MAGGQRFFNRLLTFGGRNRQLLQRVEAGQQIIAGNILPAGQLVAQDAQLVGFEGVVHVGRQWRQAGKRTQDLGPSGSGLGVVGAFA